MHTNVYTENLVKRNKVGALGLDNCRRGEVHREFWWGNLRQGDHLEDPGVDGRITIKMDLQEGGWRVHGLV